jgi:DinB superfamily/Activator of Hsp90 ATPase homolog 1-like protein
MSMPNAIVAPVRKTVTVKTDVGRAFAVFTEGIDTWWPRSHHIGSGTLDKTVIEPKLGGRCYGRTTDGVECDWGRVLVWEPPQRFVMAWQITPEWKHQPDLAQSSEVEVRFTPVDEGSTRVDLEHRHFERHGAGGDAMRAGVDAPNGWTTILSLFADTAQRPVAAAQAGPTIPAAPMAYIFRLNTGLMSRAIDGLTDEQAWTRPTAQNNAMLWIIAHAISVRTSGLKLLGRSVDTGWGNLFGRGTTPRDTDIYPSRAEILRVHGTVAETLDAALASLTAADLARPAAGIKLPAAETLSDQIAFLALHDSYHVGQLGYIRKELGFSALVG